jgi:tetratricopeptide (TPR) repeat protein
MLAALRETRPPGVGDLGRAVHLAMLGHIDDAWALAQPRADHLTDVTGSPLRGGMYLALLATIEGDRERACRHHQEMLDAVPAGMGSFAASYELLLARDLYSLGRYDQIEPLVRHARSVPGVERLGYGAEALLLTARGRFEEAEAAARIGVSVAEDEIDNLWLEAWSYEDLATVLEHQERTDDARAALERSLRLWERKGCLPCAARTRAKIDSLATGVLQTARTSNSPG